MLTPKVTETVRLSPHRRPSPRPVPPTMSAAGRRRHGGGPLSAH
ncbi:MAG: hypothetical protein QOH72_4087 [Solirubrobacteraceae bacterium]|jgi:hypothetical protein|nr:hypothetical protein [Solirubrobacteraceae bacterium]